MWKHQQSVSSIIVVDQALALNSCKISAEPEVFQRGGESYKEVTLVQNDLNPTRAVNVFCSQGRNDSSLHFIYWLGYFTKQPRGDGPYLTIRIPIVE